MKKMLVSLLVCLSVGLLVCLLAGCSPRTETSNSYYSPSWVRNGKLILLGYTSTVNKDALGSQLGSSSAQYIFTVYPSGTDESASLFDVTAETPYAMSCSPATDYLAYMAVLDSGLFRKLVIRNIATGTHTGVETIELRFNPGIKAFDWSNNGQKLVYCTSTEVRTINMDGTADTLVVADTNLQFVAWKNGGRIAFVRTSGADKLLSLIYPDGTGRVDLAAASSVDLPQISAANTNEVFGVVADSYAKVDASSGTRTTVVVSGFTGELPRLSQDATQITYSKANQTTGVYVLDLSTKAETKVK